MQRVSSEEFSCSLEFMGAGIKSGIVMLGWMCFPVLRLLILSCTYIVLACGKDLRLLVAQPSTEEYVNSGGAEATADVHSGHRRVRIKEVCWNSDV